MKRHKKKSKEVAEGTPAARFIWIMDELEERYPDPAPLLSSPPEMRYLAAIDYERNVLRNAIKMAQIAIDDWLHIHASEEFSPEVVAETRNRLSQFGTAYYIAMVQQQLTKALNGDQNQNTDR